MLAHDKNTLSCPDCGRSWHFMELPGINAGDPCPSDDCPSNAKPIGVVHAVCKDFDGNGIFSVGAIAALQAMSKHWKEHLAEGHNPRIISEDIDELKNQLEIMRAEIMRRILLPNEKSGPCISAEAHSDDRVFEVEFDAADWFAQASDEEITALAEIEWRGDREADEVAEYFTSNSELATLFDYVGKKGNIGFECSIDPDDAMAWVKQHRPELWTTLSNLM